MTDQYLSSFDYELLADALDVLDPDGSEATRRKQELEAWARAMAATGRGYLPPARPGETAPLPQVLIHLDGGLVQDIIASSPIHAVVLDYDTDGADLTDLFDIPQTDGDVEEGFVSDWGTIRGTAEDAAFIAAALASEPSYPKAKAADLRREAERADCNEQARASLIAEAERLEAIDSEKEREQDEIDLAERERSGASAFKAGLRRACNPVSERPEFADKRAAWFRGYDAELQAKAAQLASEEA
jgi:hypothetical protein